MANYASDKCRFDRCASDNPVAGVERVKVNGGDVEISTPAEITRLLQAAQACSPDFLPGLAIVAFAGLRSAEIERLEWNDIHLVEKFSVIPTPPWTRGPSSQTWGQTRALQAQTP